VDFSDVIVRKPWGHEYLCYRNESIAIWFLHIAHNKQTSLHCHPNKHTGFVILDGTVEVSFLRGSKVLSGLDKIHIFRARFHSSKAVSSPGAFILEIETPEDKYDLIRLEDAYGRAGESYENQDHFTKRDSESVWIPEAAKENNRVASFYGCAIEHQLWNSSEELRGFKKEDVFVVTSGGLVATEDSQILWPGDVVDGESLERLANVFKTLPNSTALQITKDD
jgi:hypothetical protein